MNSHISYRQVSAVHGAPVTDGEGSIREVDLPKDTGEIAGESFQQTGSYGRQDHHTFEVADEKISADFAGASDLATRVSPGQRSKRRSEPDEIAPSAEMSPLVSRRARMIREADGSSEMTRKSVPGVPGVALAGPGKGNSEYFDGDPDLGAGPQSTSSSSQHKKHGKKMSHKNAGPQTTSNSMPGTPNRPPAKHGRG